jgi:hypothetical protein
MGGGLMQLVAYGAQDIYLTGNPQITFFKVVYRRHTNFSMEAIEQTWNGSDTTNGRCTATISRNGDLVSRMWFDLAVGANGTDGRNLGSAWITSVELEIGGQKIDKHTGLWMETWAELTQPNDGGIVSTLPANNAAGVGTNFQNMSGMGGVIEANVACQLYVPLQFWFCRNPGLALPLIALQYHEVKVILEHVIATSFDESSEMTHNKLWAEYIYLDTDERRRFAQVSHEYLIEQVQFQTLTASTGGQDINFNHPVKELIWTAASGTSSGKTTTDLAVPGTLGTTTYQLKLNGHDRFAEQKLQYFSRWQVDAYHTGCGGLDASSAVLGGGTNDSICVYSFALKPEEHQPSGTCNFSRIDNAQIVAGGAAFSANTTIFAVNYNVLRIMSGMGGLAYSN